MELQPRNINFDSVWLKLRETVEHLICLEPIKHQAWNSNFSDIYFLCVSVPESHSHKLYFALKEFLESHVNKIRESLSMVPNEELLAIYNAEWNKYSQGTNYMHNLFGFLNKQLKKERQDIESQRTFYTPDIDSEYPISGVGEMSYDIWKTGLIGPLSERLVSIVIELIKKDRIECSSPPGCSEIRATVMSFVEVNIPFSDGDMTKSAYSYPDNHPTEFYASIFEAPFLYKSAEYYQGLAQKEFATYNCAKYMKHVIDLMEEERNRAIKYLHSSTLRKIELLCSHILVQDEIGRFSEVCRDFIEHEQVQDLKNMHILLRPLPAHLPILTGEFENYIRKTGMSSVFSAGSEPGQFVSSIQFIHEKFLQMIIDVFDNDSEFHSALERALQSVVNYKEDPKQPPKISERLNRYIDSLLRSKKGRSDTDVEVLMSKAIVIFRYIDDKDLFQKYYSKMLSNRLIAELSTSMDLEELMITKMREACGYEFTSKFSRMYTDIVVHSKTMTQGFNEFLVKEGVRLEVPTSVMILQAGSWPLSSIPTQSDPSSSSNPDVCTLGNYAPPMILQESLQHFERYYSTKHNGRKLSWIFNHSFADVQLNYLDRQYIATMTVYQLSILLEFSTRDEIPLSFLVGQSSLPIPVLLKCTKGLVDAGILRSVGSEDGQHLNEMSVLSLNTDLVSKRIAFKVPTPQSSKTQEKEVEATCSTVQNDRKYYLECAVVRVMKARKVMKHNALIDEVIKQAQTKFVPDVQSVKKTIESLIDKMYIQRTDENDEYEYIS